MLGTLIFSALAAYTTLGIGNAIDKLGKKSSSNSYVPEEKKYTFNRYSENDNVSPVFNERNGYSVCVWNDAADKFASVSARNMQELVLKVNERLKEFAEIEAAIKNKN